VERAGEGVQRDGPVRDLNALGTAGGAAGEPDQRGRALVELGRLPVRFATRQQLLVGNRVAGRGTDHDHVSKWCGGSDLLIQG
jgi:hypothetical protein